MVRPHSGSPRSKHRPFSDSYSTMNHEGRFGPPSRSQRGFRGPPGKAPPSWRDNNSSGPQPYPKRPSHMGERRERHGQWMQQNQDHFHSYPGSQDSQRGRRRPSPPRSNRPPPVHHRQSPHGPIHGPPSHRAPLFHGTHNSHTSPSRHFHGPPSERRVPSPHTSFRGPQRRPSPAQEHERSWGPPPRERHFGRPPLGGPNWNGPGGYPHPPSGDSRLSGPPQRKPREFHGRSSYQERWSAERDQRTLHHGEVGRESRHPSLDWAHGGEASPHFRPPYRSLAPRPSSGPSSRFYPPLRPQERPMKRKFQDFRRPPPSGLEHGPPKRFRRELSVRPLPLRGFRGHGLTLNDKSRLLKARKFRAESETRFKLPPPRPRIADRVQKPKPQTAPRNNKDSRVNIGVQPRKVPLKKGVKMPSSRESSPNTDSKTAEPERDSETKVESRRSVSTHSSSPIDKRLSRDLVVVSHWEAGHKPSTSPKNNAPWRNRAPKNKSESSESDGSLTLNERFTKLQSPSRSSQEQKDRRPSGSPEKTLRKPGSFQRPNFRPVAGVKRELGPDGVSRKPLMGSIIPRPPFNQKPVFKKSQSIMSKYKNLQTLRHKAPHQRQATSYRRW